MADSKSVLNVQVNKAGARGKPSATVLVDPSVSVDRLAAGIKEGITRNTDLRKALGLKACTGCISGFDLDIRHRFERVFEVDLSKVASKAR